MIPKMQLRAKQTAARRAGRQRSDVEAYVYAIMVDGITRYIGKGRATRMLTHALNARRDASKQGLRLNRLRPLMHRNLVRALRAGSQVSEIIIASGLSDTDAYRLEARMIAEYHRDKTGQLWNTIDERFMDRQMLPPWWRNPAHPNYRLPRPLMQLSRAELMRKLSNNRRFKKAPKSGQGFVIGGASPNSIGAAPAELS